MVVVVALLSHGRGHGLVAGIGLPAGEGDRARDGALGGEGQSGAGRIGAHAGLRRTTPLVDVHGRGGCGRGRQCRDEGDRRVTHRCFRC